MVREFVTAAGRTGETTARRPGRSESRVPEISKVDRGPEVARLTSMVHIMGHYFNAAVFWAVVPTACGVAITEVISLVVYALSPNRRQMKIVGTSLDVM